jgi:microcystin-dependent protein
MPLYGYVAKITSGVGNWTGSAAVGGYIQFKNNTTSTWTTNQPSTGQNLIYEAQPEITAQVIAVSGADVWVQVLPVYTISTKTFVYPNLAFTTGGVLWNNTGAFTTSKYRVLDSTGKIIHTNNSVSAVSLVAFNTPDMRGRFALGINTSALDEAEADTANTSAISGIYALGSEGGEEKHTLTTDEMASHSHGYSATDPYNWNPNTTSITDYNKLVRRSKIGEVTTMTAPDAAGSSEQLDTLSSATLVIGATGGNASHNNMPPYLAVRYIIKAKPYTRAAIIDGLDLPWQSTLVRDLRTRAIGGSNSDLVFYTNTAGDSGLGTERMRLTNRNGLRLTQQDGYTFGINIIGSGTNPGSTTVSSVAAFLKFYNPETPINPYTWWCPRDGIALSVESHSTNEGAIIDQYSTGGVGTPLFTVTSVGNVGIGNSAPAVALDVVGQARTSVGTTAGSNAKTLTTKDYVETFVGVTHGSFTVNASEYTEALLFSTDKPTGAAKDIYTFPTGTVLLTGNFLAMIAGSVGVRLYADFLDASNNIVLRVFLCGANDLVGSITGSNGTMRVGWCTCVPRNATKIKFYPASISGSTNTLSSVYDVRVNNALVLNI